MEQIIQNWKQSKESTIHLTYFTLSLRLAVRAGMKTNLRMEGYAQLQQLGLSSNESSLVLRCGV